MVNALVDDDVKLVWDSNENLVWLNIGYENTKDFTPKELKDLLEVMINRLEELP